MKIEYKEEYIIERSKWVCGRGRFTNLGLALLLNSLGRMCCIGQMCQASGVPDYALEDWGCPCSLKNNKVPTWMTINSGRDNSEIVSEMMEVNDDRKINQPKRESKLKGLAASIGIKLIFRGRLGGVLAK